jgi:GT2 family glycosyltransferase
MTPVLGTSPTSAALALAPVTEDDPERVRAAVVVVHWGKTRHTLACLESITHSTLKPAPLIVIDNGTGALTAQDVAAVTPGAILVSLPENLGFAGGSNVAIRRALAEGADYVLLLNNDAVLAPDCLAELVRVARDDRRVAAVGAKVLAMKPGGQLWMAYGRVTYRAALVKLVGQGEIDDCRLDEVCDVDFVPGCAMLLSRHALETVGFLDNRFFAYHEDVDWCTMARDRGFRVVFAPRAEIAHYGEGSLGENGTANAARYLSARNSVLFAHKHASPLEWLRLCATVGGSLPLAWLRSWRDGGRETVRLLARGYRDGLLGRRVPYRRLGLRG